MLKDDGIIRLVKEISSITKSIIITIFLLIISLIILLIEVLAIS